MSGVEFTLGTAIPVILCTCIVQSGCLPRDEDGSKQPEQNQRTESGRATGKQPEAGAMDLAQVEYELDVPFQLLENGRLVVGLPSTWDGSEPAELWQRLYVITDTDTILVASLEDLAGHVRVRQAEEALGLCRLKTSPVTWHLWSKSRAEMEVVHKGQITAAFCFGIERECEELLSSIEAGRIRGGGNGIIPSKERLQGLGLRAAHVREVGGEYEITRPLLVQITDVTESERHLAMVTERVSRSGQYRRTSYRQQSLPDEGITWYIELHE